MNSLSGHLLNTNNCPILQCVCTHAERRCQENINYPQIQMILTEAVVYEDIRFSGGTKISLKGMPIPYEGQPQCGRKNENRDPRSTNASCHQTYSLLWWSTYDTILKQKCQNKFLILLIWWSWLWKAKLSNRTVILVIHETGCTFRGSTFCGIPLNSHPPIINLHWQ